MIEVLSPSARDFDTFGKPEEYKEVASVDAIAFIEPNAPVVSLWERDDSGQWGERRIEGLGESIAMPSLGIILKMEAVYEGVEFPRGPRLVSGE